MKRLPLLCPQCYEGTKMVVTPCNRCTVGWDKELECCTVPTGAEHLLDNPDVPNCPIQDRCQHQIQSSIPCIVRQKGLICESALVAGGMSEADAFDHPLSFNDVMMG